MIVLDTNVISELMRPVPSRQVIAWLDDNGGDGFAVTAVSVAELRFGVRRLPDGKRRTQLLEALELVFDEDLGRRILPFDAAAADAYAELAAARERDGRPVAMADAQIASTCLVRGLPLATRNVSDFTDLGLTLLDPWDV